MEHIANALRLTCLAGCFVLAGAAYGQSQTIVALQVNAADQAAIDTSTSTAIGGLGMFGLPLQNSSELGSPDETGNTPPALPAPGYYNTDLDDPFLGPVVSYAQHHPIYVNKPPSHWGDPATFLTDLGKSQFIHLLDQYVGSFADNR